MKIYFSGKDIPFFILSFFIPLLCFLFTSSHSLMFDDAGEFALVIKLGSIAHPPGTPSYILAGMIWLKITSLFGMNTVDSLTLFAAFCVSISSLLLYCIFKIIAFNLQLIQNFKNLLIVCVCAISFSTASTSWAWGNTVEVYSFQVLTMAIALFGLTAFHFDRKSVYIFISAFGIATGLGNHHLTMILFLPFVPLFFLDNFLIPELIIDKKKKIKKPAERFINRLYKVFSLKIFWVLTGTTFLLTCFYYGWMMIRAQHAYPFMFGQPHNLNELFYHIRGGSYINNISSTPEQIISSRLPYFLKLTALQLFVFLPLFIAGLITLFRKKMYILFWMILLYFLMLFIYQVNNDQWASTDAYMLLPFMLLSLTVFYGAFLFRDKIKAHIILPILLVIQIVYNFPLHDRRYYPVSESLMHLLDKSAPQNSIVIIADWSLLIQYYYYRIVENFRPDLIVLNNDIKFTNYKILPTLYPAFYKSIQPEYDYFVQKLESEHPHQVINTGCDLSTPELSTSFRTLIHKIEEVAKSGNKNLLTDPRSHYFMSTNNFYDGKRFVSGCFSSSMPGDSSANDYFLNLDFPFLNSPLLFTDPSALDKLVDFQAMLDRHIEFYTVNKDSLRLSLSQSDHEIIISMQQKMKKSMSFAYNIK